MLYSLLNYLKKFIPKAVKNWGRKPFFGAVISFRKISARKRALPDFIVIGAQRAGTTSFFDYLTQHPDIYAPITKEVHYFDRNYEKGEMWYRAFFPKRKKVSQHAVVGEATPAYLFREESANRIKDLLPDAKLIVLLRNPVDRALSQYFMGVRDNKAAVDVKGALFTDDFEVESTAQHIQRGIYIDQLKRYKSYLDNGNLLVLSSEEFFENPKKVLAQTFLFLGVDEKFEPLDISPRNSALRSEVPEEIYEKLEAFFKPYNERLYEYLGRDFGW